MKSIVFPPLTSSRPLWLNFIVGFGCISIPIGLHYGFWATFVQVGMGCFNLAVFTAQLAIYNLKHIDQS